MNLGRKTGIVAIVSALALAFNAAGAAAKAKAHHHLRQAGRVHSGSYIRGLRYGSIAAAGHNRWAPKARAMNLVGDPGTGLGFYALPLKYRIGAWRYHLTHRRPWWSNPVLFAIAADAARYNYWIPANREYLYGVFNPYEGVGTPFFGGYYRGLPPAVCRARARVASHSASASLRI